MLTCPGLAAPVSAVDGGCFRFFWRRGPRPSHRGGGVLGGGALRGLLPVRVQLTVFTVNPAERVDQVFGTAVV